MAKLTSAERNALPDSAFAGPDRSYPVNDESHARNAKARASQAVHEGRMSSGEESRIDAKADRKLGGAHHGERRHGEHMHEGSDGIRAHHGHSKRGNYAKNSE